MSRKPTPLAPHRWIERTAVNGDFVRHEALDLPLVAVVNFGGKRPWRITKKGNCIRNSRGRALAFKSAGAAMAAADRLAATSPAVLR